MADPTVKVRIQADGSQATTELARVGGSANTFAQRLRSTFVVTFGDIARAAKAAFDAIRASASLEGQRAALEANLDAQGLAFDTFIAKLKEVSQAQVSTGDLIRTSSEAILRGIPADRIADLLEVATAQAVATGKQVSEVFEDLARAVATGSGELLRTQGFLIDLGQASRDAGQALSLQERQHLVLNEVLRIGRDRVEAFGGAATNLSTSLNQGTAAVENFRDVLGKVVGVVGTATFAIIARLTEGFLLFGESVARVVFFLSNFIPGLEAVAEKAQAAFEEMDRLRKSVQAAGDALVKAGNDQIDLLLGLEKSQKSTRAYSTILDSHVDALDTAGRSTSDLLDLNELLGDSFENAGSSAQRASIQFVQATQTAGQALAAALGITGTSAQNPQLTLAQRQAIFGNQAQQRRGDIAGRAGSQFGPGGLFPGLSGTSGTFTINTGQARALPNGRLVF